VRLQMPDECDREIKKGDNHGGHRGTQGYTGKEQELAEGWQLDQVVVGNLFHRVPGFAPGTQATGDYEDFESEFL
jgi:hypothetical protein